MGWTGGLLRGAPTAGVFACPPPCVAAGIVPVRTRVCVSPACPPGSHCLTRAVLLLLPRSEPLPVAKFGTGRGGGGGAGAAGGEPEVCSTRNDVRAGRRVPGTAQRHRRNRSCFRCLPASSSARLLLRVQGLDKSPLPSSHWAPPWEEPLASYPVCEVLRVPGALDCSLSQTLGTKLGHGRGDMGSHSCPLPTKQLHSSAPSRDSPQPRCHLEVTVSPWCDCHSKALGVSQPTVSPPQHPTPPQLPPSDAGGCRKRIAWVR